MSTETPEAPREQPDPCSECAGKGIEFRKVGSGRHDWQHRFCSRINEPGHSPTPDETLAKLRAFRDSIHPSGRYG
jgi:hypothetical protein